MLIANVTAAINHSKLAVRFCTLTLRATSATLVDVLQRFTETFKSLRRRKWWKENVQGGALFIETKLGANSGAWHVHGHLLVETAWLDQKTLSAEWYATTGDSYIVDVRPIHDPAKRAAYVCKYATKPADESVLRNPDKLQEFVVAIKGKRLFQCFGTWKDFALEESHESRANLTVIGNVEHLFASAKAGDADAQRWIEAATRKWPALAQHNPHPTLGGGNDPAP